MQYKTLVVCASAAALAAALACSKNPETPVAPSSSQPGVADAAADGSTLKVSAPTPQSPVNEQQPDSLVLTAGKSTATYGSETPLSYEFEIKNSGNTTVCGPTVVGGGSGSTVSWTPTLHAASSISRTRGACRAAVGNGTRPVVVERDRSDRRAGGYIRGNEVFDPLTNGRTAGDLFGPTTFGPNGIKLLDH